MKLITALMDAVGTSNVYNHISHFVNIVNCRNTTIELYVTQESWQLLQ